MEVLDGLAVVGVDDFGSGIRRAVDAEVGVADGGVSPDLARGGGGVHSAFSVRCTGLRRDKIDCTGGEEYLAGMAG